MKKVERALISLTDKSGIETFAGALAAQGIEILSTGGTAAKLREAGVDVIDVSDFTGFPEMLDGRVKTLHPKVHGGILHQRANTQHLEQCKRYGLKPIDIVAVNLYAFEKTIDIPGCRLEDAIENIDIGGPTLLRAAAKNFQDVTVIVDPDDYQDGPARNRGIRQHDTENEISVGRQGVQPHLEIRHRDQQVAPAGRC